MPLYGHEMNEEITPKMAGLPCKLTGMGYIPAGQIEIGKHLNADVRGRMVELEIVPMPFYKLDK